MTADPGEILVPKPERTSILQVGFETSPRLNDAMHRFLLPGSARREYLFKTKQSRRLYYNDSNNDGIRYHPAEAEQLAEDRRRLRAFGTLPVAIAKAEVGQSSKTGDVQVHLELQLTSTQRQLLGGFVLHELTESSEQPLLVYTRLSHRSIRPLEGLARAGLLLEYDLGIREIEAGELQPAEPWTLYVANPSITERAGDIHAVHPS